MPGADAGAALRRAEQLRSNIEDIVVRYLEKNLPRIGVAVSRTLATSAGSTESRRPGLVPGEGKGRNRVELSGAAAMDADVPELHSVEMHRVLARSF
jgi:hypothetical protein